MENHGIKRLTSSVDSLQNQLSHWSSFAKTNYDDLRLFRDKVLQKSTSNSLEEQVKNDVILNLEKMMNCVQEDLLFKISKLNSELQQSSQSTSQSCSDLLYTGFENVAQCIHQMQTSIKELRKRSKHYLKRREFGKRHGYYTLFYDHKQPVNS